MEGTAAVADGSSPFKPQTVLLSVSRAVGPDETRHGGLEHGFPCEHQKRVIQKGASARRLALLWFMAASRRR